MEATIAASIVIPAWNGAAWLATCLDSLITLLPHDCEIIVVDDASSDGSAEMASRYSGERRVRVFQNAVNSGFGKTVNRGLAAACGGIRVLLNQDTQTIRDWLTPLRAAMAADDGIGIAGCRLLYPDGRVQHAGGRIDVRGEGLHFREDPPLDSAGLADPDYVTGAALAISQRCYETIGPMDEGFGKAYYEDVDWCFRARAAGFRVVYYPRAELIHAEVSSGAGVDIEGMARFQANRLRFALKHFSSDDIGGRFLWAELDWLRGLAPGAVPLAAAMQRAYYRQLLGLGELERARAANRRSFEKDEMDTISQALVTLRATVPLAGAAAPPAA
ncbi:MAG: glycosyltransferase family 2 protein [Thermoflexales bacterium]